MTFEIENIPVVRKPRRAHFGRSKYPFSQLKVGQSFFVLANGRARSRGICSVAYTWGQNHGRPMAVDPVYDKTKRLIGFRVGRVA